MQGHITRLPVEVLQKIATLCEPRDILHLNTTCRFLYDSCHNAFVFQECFFRHSNEETSDSVAKKNALRDLIRQALRTDEVVSRTAVWARLSSAVSRLPLIIDELEEILESYQSVPWESELPWPELLTERVTTLSATLSTLAVLGYHTINNFAVAAALSGFLAHLVDQRFWQAKVQLEPLRFSQLTFCLATGTLGNHVLNNMRLLSVRTAGFMIQGHDQDFLDSQATGFLASACMPWLLNSHHAVGQKVDIPYLPALPLLRAAYATGSKGEVPAIPLPKCLPNGGERETSRDEPPTEGSGSLSALVTSMRAFNHAPSWQSWLRCTVNTLIDEIDRGEWIGYYTYGMSNASHVDPPLRNIHFSTAQHPEDDTKLLLTAEECVDGIAMFRLHGYLSRVTGYIALSKDYYGGHQWENTGWLTPLGITGFWGGAPGECLGFTWMYKKEWTQRDMAKEQSAVEADL